jgi:hypothetical protein
MPGACSLPWAKEAQLPLEPFPEIRRWHDNLMTLPAGATVPAGTSRTAKGGKLARSRPQMFRKAA